MASSYAEKKTSIAQRALSKWNGSDVELWSFKRGHRTIELRFSLEEKQGCLILSLGDVSKFCGPLRWDSSRMSIASEEDLDGHDIYVAIDEKVRLEIRAGAFDIFHMTEKYPK